MHNNTELTYYHHGSFHLNSTYWCNTYMGRQNVDIAKSSQEEQTFMDNLLGDIDALEYLIEHNLLEQGIQRIGAEQEIHLIDKAYKPAPLVMKMLPLIKDDHYTTEHATFNAEINVDPLEFSGNCISSMEKQLKQLLNKGRKALAKLNADMIYTGILPTISRKDLTDDNLTPLKRYHALATMYDGMRGEPFNIHIKGTDELITTINSTMFEGSNTSFQAHLQIEHPKFADHYNWAQLISGPVLSACTNSPLFLGRRLWRETRIALFQQSIDIRKVQETINYKIPRVFFGTDWVKSSPTEIFKEDVARHRVILYVPIKENSMKQLEQGTIPKLEALALHNGTIYRWNRPCYGIINGLPHLRIENRYLPAGPTLKDQMANMAFWLGLMTMMI